MGSVGSRVPGCTWERRHLENGVRGLEGRRLHVGKAAPGEWGPWALAGVAGGAVKAGTCKT